MEEKSKLNLKNVSIHFSLQDFENYVEPLNLLTKFLSDNNVVIDNSTNIHLGHKKDLGTNTALYYQIKKLFFKNDIYWWNLMGPDFRNLMIKNLSNFDKDYCRALFIFNPELNKENLDSTLFSTNSKNILFEYDLCRELNIPVILIK